MANKKISELTTRTPSLTDLILVGDPTSGYSYKCTVTALATIIETDISDAYVTLDTAQTISGAKTFSNNLTLTSVTNAATTQTKFLTLNGSNVVNYRTGSQVLADIGASDDTLVVHKAGDETITGIKTFSARGKFDAGINLKQGSGASLDTGYSAISADATTFYFHRSTSIAALSVNNLTTTRTYTLQDANGTLAFLSDIPSLTGYVPTSRTLTINGTSYDLSANRTWSVGTVTSVGLSTGTTGTDISVSGSPVTSSGTITLNIPTASATNRGALSSTDWTTFNNKQNAITLTTTGTSGAATLVGSTLNIPQYQSVLTNPVTGTGTTNYIPKFTSSSAIGNSLMQEVASGISFGGPIYAQDGTSTSASIRFYNSNSGLYYPGSDGLGFITNATEKMRLTSGGSLGIGMTSPAYTLDVNGTGRFTAPNSTAEGLIITGRASDGASQISINNNGGSSLAYIYNTSSESRYFANTGIYQSFWAGGSERMRITSNGSVLINTTTQAGSNGGLNLNVTSSGAETVPLAIMNRGTANNTTATISFRGLTAASAENDYAYIKMIETNTTTPASDLAFWTQSGSLGERMRITSGGNVGIGTTSPTQKLDVQGSGGTIAQVKDGSTYAGVVIDANSSSTPFTRWSSSGTGKFEVGYFSNQFYFNNNTGVNNTNAAMVITSSNNVGIGTTSPTSKLTIVSNSPVSTDIGFSGGIGTGTEYAALRFRADTYNWTSAEIRGVATNGGVNLGVLQFFTSDAERMRITSGGNVGIGTTSPTRKLDVNGSIAWGASSGQYMYAGGTSHNFAYSNSTVNVLYSGGTGGLQVNNQADNSVLMLLTDAGNVGIGVSNPGNKLTVNGDIAILAGNGMYFNNSVNTANSSIVCPGGGSMSLRSYGTEMIGLSENANIIISTSGSERMRITSAGELLINTTSDAGDYKLQVNGNSWLASSSPTSNTILGIRNGAATGSNTSFAGIMFSSSPSVDFILGKEDVNTTGVLKIKTQSGTELWSLTNAGAMEVASSIKTAAPSGGTAKPIKFGEIVTLGGSNTQGVRVEIDGTVYYLVTGYLP